MNARVLSLLIVFSVISVLVISIKYTDHQDDLPYVKTDINLDDLSVEHQYDDTVMLDLNRQIGDLNYQIDLLKAQLNQLKYSEDDKLITSEQEPNSDKVQDAIDQQSLDEKVRNQALQQMAMIDENFNSQVMDPHWSQNAMSQLQNAFENQDLAGHDLLDMECKSSICKLNVIHANGADVSSFRQNLRDQVSDVFTAGAIHPGEDGGSVVYMATDSSSLAGMGGSR